MGKVFWLVVVVLSVLLVASRSRSDDLGTTTEAPPSVELSFPAKAALGPNPPRGPNAPYDVGPTEAVHDEYAAASEERAEVTKAEMAAMLLGLHALGATGVVP